MDSRNRKLEVKLSAAMAKHHSIKSLVIVKATKYF